MLLKIPRYNLKLLKISSYYILEHFSRTQILLKILSIFGINAQNSEHFLKLLRISCSYSICWSIFIGSNFARHPGHQNFEQDLKPWKMLQNIRATNPEQFQKMLRILSKIWPHQHIRARNPEQFQKMLRILSNFKNAKNLSFRVFKYFQRVKFCSKFRALS